MLQIGNIISPPQPLSKDLSNTSFLEGHSGLFTGTCGVCMIKGPDDRQAVSVLVGQYLLTITFLNWAESTWESHYHPWSSAAVLMNLEHVNHCQIYLSRCDLPLHSMQTLPSKTSTKHIVSNAWLTRKFEPSYQKCQ